MRKLLIGFLCSFAVQSVAMAQVPQAIQDQIHSTVSNSQAASQAAISAGQAQAYNSLHNLGVAIPPAMQQAYNSAHIHVGSTVQITAPAMPMVPNYIPQTINVSLPATTPSLILQTDTVRNQLAPYLLIGK